MAAGDSGESGNMISRLPALPAAEPGSTLETFLTAIRKGRAAPLNLHLAIGHAPPAAKAFVELAYALRFEVVLDRAIAELVIALVAKVRRSEYEWRQHEPLALAAGVTAAQLQALDGEFVRSPLFDARQRAVLAYAERVTRAGDAGDEVFAALRDHLSDREIVELTLTVAFYACTASVLGALDVRPE